MKLKQYLYFMMIFFILVTTCEAESTKLEHGKLRLAAMIDGRPAFQKVVWHLSRSAKPDQVIKTLHRHSAVVKLEPGQYKISLTMNGTTYLREMVVRSGAFHNLIVQAK